MTSRVNLSNQETIFEENLVVVDAMVIIKFHALLVLDKLATVWAREELAITPQVEEEASFSKNGLIDLSSYIRNGFIRKQALGDAEKELFLKYCREGIDKKLIHQGEASCLALAISKNYGLASDERIVREEFKRRCPGKICVHSWDIVRMARNLNLIQEKEADDLILGLYHS